jgi:hypothetical protein
MNRLNVTRLGFAVAGLCALLYGASMLIVMTGPKDTVVAFFNSILHGIDVTPIMRWEMPWWEMVIGILEVFIIGWLCGAALAIFYNLAGGKADK